MNLLFLPPRIIIFGIVALAAGWSFSVQAITATAVAGGAMCSRCGCNTSCRKVCRLKCEERKITETIWSSESEEFCEPGLSRRVCKHCSTLESDAPKPECQCRLKVPFVWWEWLPFKSPTIHERHKLMKKTVTKTIPSYRWVIEDLCEECASSK